MQQTRQQSAEITGATTTATIPAVRWDANGFGFCASTGEWFVANPTAVDVIALRSRGLGIDAIADHLTECFQVTRAAALRDLHAFLADWHVDSTAECRSADASSPVTTGARA
jgi:hypothetical protein